MVKLTMFQAGQGDFFWLAYGEENDLHHILIDSGEKSTSAQYRGTLSAIKNRNQLVDAVIFTHIDNDHIMGALRALADMSEEELPVIRAVYFNTGNAICNMQEITKKDKPEEMPLVESGSGQYSVKGALSLCQLLDAKGLRNVLKEYTIQGDRIYLSGGAELDIISPGRKELEKYILEWDKEAKQSEKSGGQCRTDGPATECRKNIEDCLDSVYVEDSSPTNGSSLAFIFQYESVRIAFLGDAYPSVCADGIKKFFKEGVEVDMIKLAHHGSGANISDELLELIRSERYLLSTTGKKLPKCLWARLVKSGRRTVVYCNYDWWRGVYCHKYFTAKDFERFIQTERLETHLIAYEGEKIKDGLWLYRTMQI